MDEQRTRSVLDPIHGLIRLTETEMKVVDSQPFQRLRSIKQNGLLHYVFPAATHTRFEHSLGVLYVAHGMLDSLALNSQVGVSKKNVRAAALAKPGEAVAFPPERSPDRDFVYRVTRLAALAHDLGHGPLSHTFDSFAPTRAALARVLDEDALSALRPLRAFMLEWGKDSDKPPTHPKNHRTPHEVVSCVLFTKIWSKEGGDSDTALAVCAAILGEHAGKSPSAHFSEPVARTWIPLIHDVIASAPADADRMDYMERDSRAIGVTYGLFDRNRVLKSLLCYRDRQAEHECYRLGVKYSGIQAIENLMQARYELFVQVYYHKTNRALGRMLEAISKLADDKMDLFKDAPTLEEWERRYLQLTDEHFFRVLLGQAGSGTPQEIQDIAAHIQSRRLWKRVLDPSAKSHATAILAQLHQEFPEERQRIVVDDTKPKALKDLDKGAVLLIRHGGAAYEAGKMKAWTKESKIIAALADADKSFVRIYYEGTDTAVAKAIRERALALAFDRMENADAATT